TDDHGQFFLAKLLPGKYSVEAKRPDLLVTSQKVTLEPGEHALNLRLKHGGIIRGRLVDDATGKAPDLTSSGAGTISVRSMGDEPEQARQEWLEKDGSFAVAVKPGRNLLLFPHPDWQ